MPEMVKAARTKEIGFKMIKLIKEIRAELKKVIWPTREQLTTSTTAVILMVLVIGIFIWVFDWGLSFIMTLLMG